MGFLRKLFGGNDSEKQQALVQAQDKAPERNEQPGFSNQMALEQTGQKDEDTSLFNLLPRAFSGMKDAGQSMWSGMKDMGSSAWEGMKDAGSSAWEGMKETGSSIKEGLAETGTAMKEGFKGGALNGALYGAAPAVKLGELGGDTMGKKGAIAGAATGGILSLPGMILGALVGGVAGAAKGIYDQLDADDKEIVDQSKDIPSAHVIYEQLAHTYAYGKGDMATLDLWGYELSSEFEDKNSGFRVIAVSPKSKDAKDPEGNALKPVVAFRGTANKGGALDDINNEGIGTFQFSRNEKEVRNTIATAKGASKPTVTGHSLGGALAQLCASRLGGMVGDIVTFQSAGITDEVAANIDQDKHKATHYRTAGDLVHSSGDTFAEGKVVQFAAKGADSGLSHLTFPLAQLNALRGKNDSDVPKVEGVRNPGGGDKWVIDQKGDYHNGHWESEQTSEKSNLHTVETFDTVKDAPDSDYVNFLGGREFANKFMDGVASLGVADRQQDFAKAWKEIRELALGVNSDEDIPKVREEVVGVVLKYEVPPMDHAKFISQAEAAMLDVLDGKVALMAGGVVGGGIA